MNIFSENGEHNHQYQYKVKEVFFSFFEEKARNNKKKIKIKKEILKI